jgi:hypothetical protein
MLMIIYFLSLGNLKKSPLLPYGTKMIISSLLSVYVYRAVLVKISFAPVHTPNKKG